MPARLIVNADDFGLTPGVNRAITELHAAGALTSATLMANGPAFADAVRLARLHPTLGIGCHVVLIDGTPLSPPETIPTLLGPDRRTFRTSLRDFAFAALLGRLNPEEIAFEAGEQIQRLQSEGIRVTHVDTHKHTHIFPAVSRPLLGVLERTSVGSIRNPFEPPWAAAIGRDRRRRWLVRALEPLHRRFQALPQIAEGRVQTTMGTLGVSATGDLDEDSLRAILAAMPSGLWELVCHPGYNDFDLDAVKTRLRGEREIERRALVATFSNSPLQPSGLQLINYGDRRSQPLP